MTEKVLLHEHWNQLDLFNADREKEVIINIKYLAWKKKRKRVFRKSKIVFYHNSKL